jgi:hypothetical protein
MLQQLPQFSNHQKNKKLLHQKFLKLKTRKAIAFIARSLFWFFNHLSVNNLTLSIKVHTPAEMPPSGNKVNSFLCSL